MNVWKGNARVLRKPSGRAKVRMDNIKTVIMACMCMPHIHVYWHTLSTVGVKLTLS